MVTREELEKGLQGFLFTRTRTNLFIAYQDLTITEGAKYLIEALDCSWLKYLIYSWESEFSISEIHIYTLRIKGNYGVITCRDAKRNTLRREEISSIKLPVDSIVLYHQEKNILLPMEY